jgi:enoyl-CoA hydratase
MMNKHLRTTDYLIFEVKERIARITLNRPEARNALFPKMLAELRDALLEADDRNDVNVVILQGAGKDFCAGYDLKGAYAGFTDGQVPWDETQYRTQNKTIDDDIWNMEQTGQLAMTLFDMHKPVVAKVHGNCLAGGTDIALLCDMVIAAEDAKIGFPAARANGTPPNQMWLYHVGPQWTKRILMTGDNLRGHEAARIGLVLDAVPADQLDLLSAHKRAVNMGLELMGARTMQRICAELDARAHLNAGPRRTQFKADMAALGLKDALKKRDEPFGDGMVKSHFLQKKP